MKNSESDINFVANVNSEKHNTTGQETVVAFLLSLYVVLALNFNLDAVICLSVNSKTDIYTFLSSFNKYNIQQIFMFIFGFYVIYKAIQKIQNHSFRGVRDWGCHIIPATLFSMFVVFGSFFSGKADRPVILTANQYQMAVYLFVFGGYFILFLALITLLFAWLDSFFWSKRFGISGSFIQLIAEVFDKNPFIITFLVLLIGYIPNLILSYPAIFTVDSVNQIIQGYNFTPLKNHHPVLHTMLLHSFIAFGKAIYSYNFGIFLYVLFQILFFITAVSYSAKLLVVYCKVCLKSFSPVILYFIIHPMIQNYAVTLTKDPIYVSALLIFFSLSFIYLKERTLNRNQLVIWLLSIAGVVLFRNEGIYLVLSLLLAWMLLYGPKRKIGIVVLSTIVFFISWNRIILPFFSVEKGSVREMLSIPFQQTARYVKYRPNKVTKQEKKDINAVLHYGTLGKRYNPNWAVPVKDRFNSKSTRQNLRDYLKVWLTMFIKEPKLYLEAVLANKYKYFYPGHHLSYFQSYNDSKASMERLNLKFQKIVWNFNYPVSLNQSREHYQRIRKSVFSLPVLSILICSSSYIWIVVLLIFFVIKNKTTQSVLLAIPLTVQLLVLIAGPRNGDQFRYVYPIAVLLPFLFFFIMEFKINKNLIITEK